MIAANPVATTHLADAVLLNRAIYGGVDDLPTAFLADYDPSRDPDAVGKRAALNVYDRYDNYLKDFGFRTLSSAELGFPSASVSASEATDGLDHNFTYRGGLFRNNFQTFPSGVEVPFTNAGAVALVAVKQTAAGNELHLVFRGTDADLGIDGEAGTGPGQVRHYEQLKGLIDQVYAFAANAANGIREIVVSGHSLGGAVADLFALYDGARFAALENVGLSVLALASAGVAPDALTLRPDFDRSLVAIGTSGIGLQTPDWYASYDNAKDIVRNPERYDFAAHLKADPEQAPITNGAVATLRDHLHFDGHRLSVETPLIDQYAVSAKLETNFLAAHYASYYELIGTELAKAAALGADLLGFERVVALNGTNPESAKTPGNNDANGFGLPVNDHFSDRTDARDTLVVGINGNDTIETGTGDDFLFGGAGNDTLIGNAGRDTLIGGDGWDILQGGSGDDRLDGGTGYDRMSGGTGDDTYVVDNPFEPVVELAGEGNDTIESSVSLKLRPHVENLVLSGTAALDGTGNNLANRIAGNSGDNRLDGGFGNDVLTGGAGRDTFVFSTALNARTNADTITDFNHADDTIWLARDVFTALNSGPLTQDEFTTGKAATTVDQHVVYDRDTGKLYYDADGSGLAAQVLFATLTNKPALGFDDFVVA